MIFTRTKSLITFLLFFSLSFACGSSSSETSGTTHDTDQGDGSSDEYIPTNEPIRSEKLINTPFESFSSAEDIPETYFICNQFRTETINSFPIPVFAAYFTASEEAIVAEGIQLTNNAMGFEAYQLTDIWNDINRVIINYDNLPNKSGHTIDVVFTFNRSSPRLGRQSADWVIQVQKPSLSPWLVAHELGHASAIGPHMKIDYVNDTYLPLESNSLMLGNWSRPPEMADYNEMLYQQGLIMQQHLGERGTFRSGTCN